MTPEVFSRDRRRLQRARAVPRFGRVLPLFTHAANEMLARLAEAGRSFDHALLVGAADASLAGRLGAGRVTVLDPSAGWSPDVTADEDRLPFGPAAFDLVAAAGTLHLVNDLPGALVQLRLALRPDGRLVGFMPGGETLTPLRRALYGAEEALTGRVVPRLNPAVDAREMPSLLQRAGFLAPVVDVEALRLRYRTMADLVLDLRAAGETAVLAGPVPALSRAVAEEAARRFAAQAEPDGRVTVRGELMHFAADAPGT